MSGWMSESESRAWLDAPAVAKCDRCGRSTWDAGSVGTEDRMTQPDGNPCGGRFVAASPVPETEKEAQR